MARQYPNLTGFGLGSFQWPLERIAEVVEFGSLELLEELARDDPDNLRHVLLWLEVKTYSAETMGRVMAWFHDVSEALLPMIQDFVDSISDIDFDSRYDRSPRRGYAFIGRHEN